MANMDFLGEALFKDSKAQERGRLGGRSSSRRKRKAARANGAKGGWKAMDDLARMRFKIDRSGDPRFQTWGRMGGIKGGKRSSARKREASRTNGMLGGRPKKEGADGAGKIEGRN